MLHDFLVLMDVIQLLHPKRQQATELSKVKQPQDQSNSKMGDHLGSIHSVYFSGRNIRQICQILLISLNCEKIQLFGLLFASFFITL